MPSFNEMRAKASKVASSGVEKAQGYRDRNTSVPMKKTNWDPYSGAPPPPPPPRISPNKPTALAPFPPPPSRTGSSIGSGSTRPATLDRAPSTASAVVPPLPSRGSSTGAPPPPLPQRTNTLEPPPLPGRRDSTSPVSSNPNVSFRHPPPSRSPQPPPSRAPFTVQTTLPFPPVPNLTTKPGSAPVSSLPTPAPAPPPRRSPVVSPKPPTPQVEFHEPEAIPEQVEIDWANLTEEDKQVFFSWLDEFFTRLLGVPVGPRQGLRATHV